MVITKVEEGKGKKYRVYGEEGFLFSLYGKELKRYHIVEGTMLEDCVISSIMDEIIYKRGKERALYLLEHRPFSENMLCTKLKENEYPDGIVQRVVSFLKQYHYLDDLDYIQMYMNTYAGKKSIKQMKQELFKRGISKQDIDTFFEENSFSEEDGLRKLFLKYTKNKDLQDRKERQKIFRYLYGKGYSSSLIQSMFYEMEHGE